MNFFILFLVAAFQLLNNAMADWGLDSPLILTNISTDGELKIPSVVRWSNEFQCKVYYGIEHKDIAVTYVYCPLRNENPYCNYSTNLSNSAYVEKHRPTETCYSQVLYRKKRMRDMIMLQKTCTHDEKTGHLYKFEYLLCDQSQNKTILIYEMCYQDYANLQQIILGSYTIDNPRLLAEPLLQDEQSYVFQSFHADHNSDPFFNNWTTFFRQNKHYKARAVLPPEWVLFGHQRKPLYDYTNAAPMLKNLVEGWEKLMGEMKLKLSKMNEAIHVTAGLLDVSTNPNYRRGYLAYNSPIIIPFGWWVLVYNQNNTAGVAIIMYNKMFQEHTSDADMNYYAPEICGPFICDRARIMDIIPKTGIHFIYCCEPNFIVEKFNLVVEGTNVLEFPIA